MKESLMKAQCQQCKMEAVVYHYDSTHDRGVYHCENCGHETYGDGMIERYMKAAKAESLKWLEDHSPKSYRPKQEDNECDSPTTK
jgi:ribosomal protein L37AE/L43A